MTQKFKSAGVFCASSGWGEARNPGLAARRRRQLNVTGDLIQSDYRERNFPGVERWNWRLNRQDAERLRHRTRVEFPYASSGMTHDFPLRLGWDDI